MYSFLYVQEEVLILLGWEMGKEMGKTNSKYSFFLEPFLFNMKEADFYHVSSYWL